MKHIYVNFKRFDIPKELGGVNSIAKVSDWANVIVDKCLCGLEKYKGEDIEFGMFFPEAHLLNAISRLTTDSVLKIGSQGVYRDDTSVGGNFGAFTTNLPANAASSIGCEMAIIGHCEERKNYTEIMEAACAVDTDAIDRLLNKSIKKAVEAGLSVLYCIGEKQDEQERWKEVLKSQLDIGLCGVDTSKVCIAYEPVWAIGPGKTPPDKDYITKIAKYVKEITNGLDVVYGGGLKHDNAPMLESIEEIDGGLIALTRFSGDIGFYPQEFLEIVQLYLGK